MEILRNILIGASIMMVSSLGLSESNSFDLDLNKLMQDEGFDSKSIRHTIGMMANGFSWNRGFSGDVERGYFSVRALNQSAGLVATGLEFDYQPLRLESVSAKACDVMGLCKDVTVKTKHQESNLTSEGVNWVMRFSQGQCKEGFACSLKIPSWALKMMSNSESAGIKSFPSFPVIVHHGGGFLIADAERKSMWANFDTNAGIDALGEMQEAHFTEKGRLIFTMAQGLLVFDFLNDRAILMDNSQVAVATTGLGGLSAASFYKISQRNSMGSDLYYADDELLGWGNGYLAMDWSAEVEEMVVGEYEEMGAVVQQYAFRPGLDGGTDLIAVSSAEGLMDTYLYSKVSHRFSLEGSRPIGDDQQVLKGSEYYIIGANKLEILREDGKEEIALPEHEDLKLVSDGNVLIKETKAGKCSWRLLKGGISFYEDLAAGGIEVGCDDALAVQDSKSGIVVTQISDGKLVFSATKGE